MNVVKRGISYPIRINGGTLATSTDDDLVREDILSVLKTKRGEYLTRPRYGLSEIIFDADAAEIINEVRNALINQVVATYPNVKLDIDGTVNSDGRIDVDIRYEVDGFPSQTLALRI